MKLLVVGAGMMARAVVHDFARQPDVETVRVADVDAGRLRSLSRFVRSRKVKPSRADAADRRAIGKLAEGCAALVSCVPYFFNLGLARAAIGAGAHFCDLGGNNDVVERQFTLDAAARKAGVAVIPDCGLAPGMVSILAADGFARLARTDEIHLRVGGLPRRPKPPLSYGLVFSANGLINEYSEPCLILRRGRPVLVEPLADVEALRFPAPFGRLEAFNTSGGSSRLPGLFAGRVQTLDYKTIRYPGHCAQMRLLFDLGLMSAAPVAAGVSPRRVLIERLESRLGFETDDVVLLRVEVSGRDRRGARRRIRYQLVDCADRKSGLTAMMRTTGFAAAVVALLAARGEVTRRGVFTGEQGVPGAAFVAELRRRGLGLVVSESVW